jgi:hypothetical protein
MKDESLLLISVLPQERPRDDFGFAKSAFIPKSDDLGQLFARHQIHGDYPGLF